MYIATSYIGGDYTPGEIIRENLPGETIERLLKAGAIRKAAPDPEAPVMADVPVNNEQAAQAPDPEPDMQEAEAPEDEIDKDAPEIDVMDGLVSASAEEQKKPERAVTRKASGGRTAKGGKTK